MRILFVTRELNGIMGGLERQIMLISKTLAERGHAVTITSLEKSSGEPFFLSNEGNVKLAPIILGDPRSSASWLTRFGRQKALWNLLRIEKPDVVVTFMIGSFIFAKPISTLLNIPVILSERNSPDIYKLTSARRMRWLYYFIASFSTRITVQFPSYIEKYPAFLRRKMVSIPNEVPSFDLKRVLRHDTINFGYAGRFSFQKRIDKLILAFDKLHNVFPNTRLLIFGNGEQSNSLLKLVNSLESKDAICFYPESKEIEKIFQSIDIFCLFSLWEGFPNILAEALACGVPCVGFSTCDGVNDLIKDGYNGWKAPFDDSGNSAFELLRKAYIESTSGEVKAESCKASVKEYSGLEIYDKWERLLENVK